VLVFEVAASCEAKLTTSRRRWNGSIALSKREDGYEKRRKEDHGKGSDEGLE
tara:strand:- start:13510 stop:13665 length:156 start_codon:yes stop_codon:yes gene_type:complete